MGQAVPVLRPAPRGDTHTRSLSSASPAAAPFPHLPQTPTRRLSLGGKLERPAGEGLFRAEICWETCRAGRILRRHHKPSLGPHTAVPTWTPVEPAAETRSARRTGTSSPAASTQAWGPAVPSASPAMSPPTHSCALRVSTTHSGSHPRELETDGCHGEKHISVSLLGPSWRPPLWLGE